MNDRFDRNTFESAEFIVESTEAPKIKAGGSSSSNIFNRFFNALGQDVSLLATRANILASRSSRIEKGCAEQSAALQSAFSSLSTRVDQASGYSFVLADMHDTFYLDTVNPSWNVSIDYNFGQATLPVTSTSDLLVQSDVYGNAYVSPETIFSYSTSSASSISVMSLSEFVADPDGIFMIKQDQTWIKDAVVGQTKGWIRIKAPLQFRGLTPNVLEIWPLPAFAMKLRSVSYRLAGDPEDTWTSLDLSYLPNYNTATQRVDRWGPVRLHLDNYAISEFVIEIDMTSSDVWGLKKIKLYHREYESVGTLVVKDPYSRSVGDISLRGKDPNTLSTFGVTKVSNKATIQMSSADSTTTPVITGVIFDVS